ncbi:C25 family cysteine peptidase [Lewinella sp. W8]|uniref:putative type IX secretion system sortase PorU2 n=1 Tax=Lewinella sp. W8 TaxID=2528208 RepID=UPI001565D475|nr:C25 family cysteine peptidase [Lewinella sp. W8]
MASRAKVWHLRPRQKMEPLMLYRGRAGQFTQSSAQRQSTSPDPHPIGQPPTGPYLCQLTAPWRQITFSFAKQSPDPITTPWMLRSLLSLFFGSLSWLLLAQMPSPSGAVRYGDEWIDFGQTYLRIAVAEDGWYSIDNQLLSQIGEALTPENQSRWVLIREGEAVPLEVGQNQLLFYGEMNRGEMDSYLFADPESQQLNPRYSIYNDTSVYYLGLRESGGPTYTNPATGTPTTAVSTIERSAELVYSAAASKELIRADGFSIYFSQYDVAEGYGSLSVNDIISISAPTESEHTLELPQSNGQGGEITGRFGLGIGPHTLDVSVNGTVVETMERFGWSVESPRYSFQPDNGRVSLGFRGSGGDQDRANVAWIRADYPANPVADESLQQFRVTASNQVRSLTLTGLGADAGAQVTLYSQEQGWRFPATVTPEGTATYVLPPSATPLELLIRRPSSTPPTATVEPASFSELLPPNGRTEYLIISSRRLAGNELEDYANYRRSTAGGGYGVHLTYVEDLYETFGYGIRRHPMALRNYISRIQIDHPELRYLLIVGKGREYRVLRSAEQLAGARSTFFVPSFGFPASDNLISAPLGSVVPTLSTGRLPVINRGEIALYLRKLRDVEAQVNQGEQRLEDREWMKQFIHLGGGITPGEQTSIKSGLGLLENVIERSRLGGNVSSFFKTSSEPIEQSRQEAIFNRINNGSSVITFFGHSSTQNFDFSIDDPDNYANFGKYPFMLSLGCYSGDAFTPERSISERFLFLPDKGAIAFAASKGVGFITSLEIWAEDLYDAMGNELYGRGIGDAMRRAIEVNQNASGYQLAILLEQFALGGDPAYSLHPRPGPDLVIDPSSVRFSPQVIPAQDEDYEVRLRVANLGSGTGTPSDSVNLLFQQRLPDGTLTDLTRQRLVVPAFAEELSVRLPNLGLAAVGINQLLITVDSERELPEAPNPSAELNNQLTTRGQLGVPLTVIANTARPAFPPQYAGLGGPITLVASTTDALAPDREYILQVDTSRSFAAPLINTTLTSPGGLIRFPLTLDLRDSTTYYWRISPDTANTQGAGFIWGESSFTYLEALPTDRVQWAQQHQGQTIDGTFTNISGNRDTPGWAFLRTTQDIKIINGLYENVNFPRLERNGLRIRSPFPWRVRAGIQVIVYDSLNFQWLIDQEGLYGSIPSTLGNVFSYDVRNQQSRADLINFLENVVETGQYVLLYTAQRGNNTEYFNESWLSDSTEIGRTLFGVLESEGARVVRGIENLGSVPYALIYQKGLGTISEALAETPSDSAVVRAVLRSNWERGEWISPPVGPAQSWSGLDFTVSSRNLTASDTAWYYLYGRTAQNAPPVLLMSDSLTLPEQLDYRLSLASLDAAQYPYLQLEFRFQDITGRSVPTISGLYFDFEEYGDVAINPQLAYASPDSLERGQTFTLRAGYENISRTDMDSLLVNLLLIDENNQPELRQLRQPPLPSGATGEVSFSIPTDEFSGLYQLQLRLNPDQDQTERILFNNTLTGSTSIKEDRVPPSLQVFFDGRRINEGELVSSRPEIHLQLRDENTFRPLNDTADFRLDLIAPSGSRERIFFDDDRVEFLPASGGEENLAEVFFRPSLDEDGTYRLQVSGQDRTGNPAGRLNFEKSFSVINRRGIGNVLPYPNPFSTRAHFVYTVTGSEPPSVFRIQIMTVSGRVVRDINLLDYETIDIGTHQTEFSWDGTDEYGDPLANGVYLYRVITTDDQGTAFEKYDDGNAAFFKNELGKIVILR